MKRSIPLAILAATLLGAATGAPGATEQRDEVALRARELVALRNGVAGRLCPGARNAARLIVTAAHEPPRRAIPVQLMLFLPPSGAGTLIAEGSLTFDRGAQQATFTFLNIEVPARLRGRGARLVARVNADRAIPEVELGDNAVVIDLDAATDWGCAG